MKKSLNRAHSYSRTKTQEDRKSTRLNSSHSQISYAVFCLKKKKKNNAFVPASKYPCIDASTGLPESDRSSAAELDESSYTLVLWAHQLNMQLCNFLQPSAS